MSPFPYRGVGGGSSSMHHFMFSRMTSVIVERAEFEALDDPGVGHTIEGL